MSEKDCYGTSSKSKGSSKAKFEAALKELREHISKLETRFAFKYPYAQPKIQIDPRKLYLKVRDDEPEDLLSDVEPEPEPEPETTDDPPPDSPEETPLQIDEGLQTPAKPSDEEQQSIPKHKNEVKQGETAPPVPTSPPESVPELVPGPGPGESAKKSEQPKSTPVQRNKIAQNLKKTLETRRSQSLTASDAEDGVALCEADAVRIAKLKAELAGLKRELEQEKRNHVKAMEAEKRRLQTAIADLQQEKEQALAKATECLKKEHEETLRTVKKTQWCAQCSSIAQY